MVVVDADVHGWSSHHEIVGRSVQQDKVTVWQNKVCGNALFVVLFQQGQVARIQLVSKSGISRKEVVFEFPGFAGTTFDTSSPMHSQTAMKATVVVVNVKGNNFPFVAKPIWKSTKPYLQGLTVQNHCDIHKQGALVHPFRIGPVEFGVLKTKLLLCSNPMLCLG